MAQHGAYNLRIILTCVVPLNSHKCYESRQQNNNFKQCIIVSANIYLFLFLMGIAIFNTSASFFAMNC